MARPGFLNENEARAYPLVPDPPDLLMGTDTVRLPYPTLVDFGCVVGLDAGYDSAQHAIWLQSVTRVGGVFTFEFRSDAPGLTMAALRFTRTAADPEFATDEAEAGHDADSDCVALRDDPLWEGFLTTGLLDALAAILPEGGALVARDAPPTIEPALVQDLAAGYVRTLNLANEDRTRATAAEGCPEQPSEALGDPLPLDQQFRTIVNRECLAGPLTVRQGYNVSIRQNARDNSLTISAVVNAGAGAPCDEVKLADRERPPAGSQLLTGGPACDELITSINGLSGSVIRLVPRQGVQILPASDRPNTLIVDVDLHDMTLCPPAGGAGTG